MGNPPATELFGVHHDFMLYNIMMESLQKVVKIYIMFYPWFANFLMGILERYFHLVNAAGSFTRRRVVLELRTSERLGTSATAEALSNTVTVDVQTATLRPYQASGGRCERNTRREGKREKIYALAGEQNKYSLLREMLCVELKTTRVLPHDTPMNLSSGH